MVGEDILVAKSKPYFCGRFSLGRSCKFVEILLGARGVCSQIFSPLPKSKVYVSSGAVYRGPLCSEREK